MIWLFLVPLIPTILWIAYFSSRDWIEKEPKRYLFYAVMLGAISTFFVAEAEGFFLNATGLRFFLGEVSIYGFGSMLIVGTVEEVAKYLTMRLSFFRSGYFNEISDGIIYAVAIGLGFAFIENIFYAMQFGLETTIIRSFFTPIFHASAAAASGYFLAKSSLQKDYSFRYIGLILAIAIHSVSNFLLVATAQLISLVPLALAVFINLFFIFWIIRLFKVSITEKPTKIKQLKTSLFWATFLNIVPGFGLVYLGFYETGLFIMSSVIFVVAGSQLASALNLMYSPAFALFAVGYSLLLIIITMLFSFKKAKDFKRS